MPDDPTEPAPRNPLVVPITGIFLLLLIHSLIFASEFLIPVTTAILGYFILNAPRRALGKIGIPSPVAAAIFTVAIGLVVTFGAIALSEPVGNLVTDLPGIIDDVFNTLRGPGGPMELVNRAAEASERVMEDTAGPEPIKVQVVGGAGIAVSVASIAPSIVSQVVFAMCLLFFLVASGDLFIQKAVQVADRFQDKRATLMTIRMIEARLGNYLGAITLINIALGVAIGFAMWVWDVPSPWLVGGMATLLNFVPFVGAVVGALVSAVVAFVTFNDLWAAIGVFGTYYVITAIEGQFITPALVGQRLRLNTTMVFLSVAFFAWVWSVMGMVVAVPSLIVLKVVCDAVPKLRKFGLFLGDAEGFVPSEKTNRSEPSGSGRSADRA